METVIILRRQSEDSKCASNVFVRLSTISIAQQASHSELATFDPKTCRLVNCFEHHQPTIGCTDETIRVIGRFDRSGRRFQFSYQLLSVNDYSEITSPTHR